MAGRKLSLETYLKEKLRYLTSSDDFRLSSFCENMNWTAFPYFCVYMKYVKKDKGNINKLNTKFKEKYKTVSLPDTIDDLNKNVQDNLYEYAKVLMSYHSKLNYKSASSQTKTLYFKTISNEIKTCSIPTYKLCKQAKVSQGNLCLFLNGQLDKLSADACSRLLTTIRNT